MILIRYLLQFLRKISLIAFLTLLSLMIFHMVIVTAGTALSWWHIDSNPYSIALTTFLYYVLPLIVLLFIYFFTSQLLHSHEETIAESPEALPSAKTVPSKKSTSSRTVPNKKSSFNKSTSARTVPNKKAFSNKSTSSRTVPNKRKG